MVRFGEDKLELFIFGALVLAVGFLSVNYDINIASVLIIMIVFSLGIGLGLPARITHNSKPHNTGSAVLWAGAGVGIILVLSLVLTTALQGILNISAEPEFSIINSGFSSLGTTSDKVLSTADQPIFAKSAFLMILTFGIIIAAIETRMLGRAMEWLSTIFNVRLDKLSVPVIAVFVLLSSIFVWYHASAKGVTNNTSHIITFTFAMISLEMIRRTGELESATYLHIFNNLLYIIPNVQGI